MKSKYCLMFKEQTMNQKKYPDAFLYFIAFVAWITMAYWAMRLGQQNVYDDLDEPPVSEYEMRGGSYWGN